MDPADSSSTDLQILLNELLKRPRYDTYEVVRFLGLFWEDGHPSYREESRALGDYFKRTFGYTDGEEFPIPSQESHEALAACVAQFILNMNRQVKDQRSGLLIIHYGGHGDEDGNEAEGQEQRSVWAA